MPSATRRTSSSTAPRVFSDTVRIVPMSSAVSGITLLVVPARMRDDGDDGGVEGVDPAGDHRLERQ